MDFFDLKTQQLRIKSLIDQSYENVLQHGKYIKGPEVGELECRLCEFTGAKYSIACANGTDALQIALMALDLSPGDEIITTDFTFFATAEVILLLGLKPVLVDIKPDTYNIDPAQIESKITNKTKAILPVSLYGQCPDMDEINLIAAKHNLVVIEDAAQSFGAKYKDKISCNISHIATTSFFPTKPLACYGDGGMVFTSDATLHKKIRNIASHGASKKYHHEMVGVNSRLDTIQAGILLAKMSIFNDELNKRIEVGSRYTEGLSSVCKTPKIKDDCTSAFAQYTIEVNDRDDFRQKLKDKGIPTFVHYPTPLHKQPVMEKYNISNTALNISLNASQKVVSLPMHPYLNTKDQDIIIQAVKESL